MAANVLRRRRDGLARHHVDRGPVFMRILQFIVRHSLALWYACRA